MINNLIFKFKILLILGLLLFPSFNNAQEILIYADNISYDEDKNIIARGNAKIFQNNEFISLIKDVISSFIPAHVTYNLLFLNVQEILIFDKIYKEWLKSISKKNSKKHQVLSLEIVQLLNKYKDLYGK